MEKMKAPFYNLIPLLLSTKTTSLPLGKIFSKTISLLQTLHLNHRLLFIDIKPDNFMLASSTSSSSSIEESIRLVDLGLVTSYRDISLGKHRLNMHPNAPVVGTPNYASLNVLNGHTPSRRDDLEALGYVLLELYVRLLMETGSIPASNNDIEEEEWSVLPWSTGTSDEEICCLKTKCMEPESDFYDTLSAGHNTQASQIIQTYFETVMSLKYSEKPNYEELISLVEDLVIQREGGKGNKAKRKEPNEMKQNGTQEEEEDEVKPTRAKRKTKPKTTSTSEILEEMDTPAKRKTKPKNTTALETLEETDTQPKRKTKPKLTSTSETLEGTSRTKRSTKTKSSSTVTTSGVRKSPRRATTRQQPISIQDTDDDDINEDDDDVNEEHTVVDDKKENDNNTDISTTASTSTTRRSTRLRSQSSPSPNGIRLEGTKKSTRKKAPAKKVETIEEETTTTCFGSHISDLAKQSLQRRKNKQSKNDNTTEEKVEEEETETTTTCFSTNISELAKQSLQRRKNKQNKKDKDEEEEHASPAKKQKADNGSKAVPATPLSFRNKRVNKNDVIVIDDDEEEDIPSTATRGRKRLFESDDVDEEKFEDSHEDHLNDENIAPLSPKQSNKLSSSSSCKIQIIFTQGPHKGETMYLGDDDDDHKENDNSKEGNPDTYIIGRDPSVPDSRYNNNNNNQQQFTTSLYSIQHDIEASSVHAKITLQHSKKRSGVCTVSITDLKSTNGTYVNGRLIAKGGTTKAFMGDKILIGTSVLQVKRGGF
mmetsp:Transcript_17752/g.26477  ORF Transcript_17752/g.26477 Transcript_17752/m.26477 type:complete len:765 (-) Transcript_17752:199-2493(-)